VALVALLDYAEKVLKLIIFFRRKLSSLEMKLPGGIQLMAFDGKRNFISGLNAESRRNNRMMACLRGMNLSSIKNFRGKLFGGRKIYISDR
jgi:hypothetical protein